MFNRHSAWTRAALCLLSLCCRPGHEPELLRVAGQRRQDAQGGVIPGATVVLINTATNERREGVSAEDGTHAS